MTGAHDDAARRMEAAHGPPAEFTVTRATSLVAGIAIAILAETVVIHVLLTVKQHALIAWALTASSVLTLLWLIGDDRSMRTRPITVYGDVLHLRVGRRIDSRIQLSSVARIYVPDWRSLPAQARDYLKASAMDDPNVVIELADLTAVRTVAGVKHVRRIGLRMDQPREFVRAVEARMLPILGPDEGR
jgi:hypothetical protein